MNLSPKQSSSSQPSPRGHESKKSRSSQPSPRGHESVDDLTATTRDKTNEEEFRDYVKHLNSKYQPVTDSGIALSVPGPNEVDTKHATAAFQRLQQTDHELFENMKKFKKDADIHKLSIELSEANSLLAHLEQGFENLISQRERNTCLLNGIKQEHEILLDEKFHIQIKLNLARKGNQAHKNTFQNKEIDQLIIAYEKLEHKEKGIKRRRAMLEAELSLINSKLHSSGSEKRKVVVPKLDLSKLKDKKKTLPPLRNAPRTQRKGVNDRSVEQVNFTVFSTGLQKKERPTRPIPSSSTPVMQEKIARMIHPSDDNMKYHTAWGTKPKKGRLPKSDEQKNFMEEAVINVNFKEKPVMSPQNRLPDIVKGSQFMDKSRVVPKSDTRRPPFCVQQKSSSYFSIP